MDCIKRIWAELERTTSLKNSAVKQKDWSYRPPGGGRPAAFHGAAPTVLGVGLPAPVRVATDTEVSKTMTAQHQLRRIGALPLPAKLRRLAAAIGPLSAATWARIVRPFTRLEARNLQASCRRG
eukprot:6535641-Alexandrium_andersonii.AAC.1